MGRHTEDGKKGRARSTWMQIAVETAREEEVVDATRSKKKLP
jgi:hypothetical protein